MSSGITARRFERLWYSDSPLAMLLQPLAWLFAAGVALRRWCYRAGWLAVDEVAVPVIVVGNITAGGTGKTPIVEWLVKKLRADGHTPGIASRGYGGRAHYEPEMVTAASRAEIVGDEPLLLARRTGQPVAVCIRRGRAAQLLVQAGADVIVADDGLQHYGLRRDLEIVVLDGERQLGNGHLLPAGPLREPPRRLDEAGLVLVNGGPRDTSRLRFDLRITSAVALGSGERCALAGFARKRVWAVAGIGHPDRFYAELRRLEIEPVVVDVPDHGRVDLESLRRVGDWPILMTEKDAVKYPECADPAAWYLPVEVLMHAQAEETILTRVRELFGRRQVAARPGPGGARGGS